MPEIFGLNSIGQIAINVHDVNRAEIFYREMLGMKHLFTVSNLAFFDCNGIRLMLSLPEKPEFDHPASVLYFRVPEIQSAYSTLKERGVRFDAPPHLIAKMNTYDLWMAFFRDSEDNLLGMMCELPR